MYLPYFLVFALVSRATAIIDCPDPDQDYKTLFQFDQDEYLNVYLRNVKNQLGYVAFAVDRHPDNTVRHLFCLPHQGQRFGGITDVDGSILLIDKNETGYVETQGTNNFQCSFNLSDLPENFHTSKSFFVSRGIWKDDLIMETQQKQLFDIKDFVISYEDEYNVFVVPTNYSIGYILLRRAKSSGFIEQIATQNQKLVLEAPENFHFCKAYLASDLNGFLSVNEITKYAVRTSTTVLSQCLSTPDDVAPNCLSTDIQQQILRFCVEFGESFGTQKGREHIQTVNEDRVPSQTNQVTNSDDASNSLALMIATVTSMFMLMSLDDEPMIPDEETASPRTPRSSTSSDISTMRWSTVSESFDQEYDETDEQAVTGNQEIQGFQDDEESDISSIEWSTESELSEQDQTDDQEIHGFEDDEESDISSIDWSTVSDGFELESELEDDVFESPYETECALTMVMLRKKGLLPKVLIKTLI
uniref:Uncharacterized protein n=1 Tax=Caenorhabditis tropicalis TaxID=1561998 RepID=A0A1I7TN72_9PELO